MSLPQEKKIPFLGEDDLETPSWASSKVVILPVPYGKTVCYGVGTENGPRAILEASSHIETFDEELETEPCQCGIFTARAIELKGLEGEAVINAIEHSAEKIVEAGKLPVALGGEHSITTGLVRPVLKKYPDLHVVHLDAHADMRDEYSGTKWSHAAVMHRIYEMGIPYTSIGIRSLTREEFDLTTSERENYFFAYEIAKDPKWIDKAIKTIDGPVYLTLDIDVFDSGVVPHTGTPEPGGLGWYQVTSFLRELFASRKVVGVDVVELAPTAESRASDFMAAKLVYKTIGYWGINRQIQDPKTKIQDKSKNQNPKKRVF